jgi:hypothetical protein
MGYSRWHIFKSTRRLWHRCAAVQRIASIKGQSTVEYALILASFLCIVIALGMLASTIREGIFVQHTHACASHTYASFDAGAYGDILLP